MRSGSHATTSDRWLRALRWVVAAVVLGLVAPQAYAAPSSDDVVLVAAGAVAGAAQSGASRAAQVDEAAPASPMPTRPSLTTGLTPRRASTLRPSPRERLYLLDCALLL